MSDTSAPTDDVRPLNLEQQRKRAKDLRRDVKSGLPAAAARLRTHHPKARPQASDEDLARDLSSLSDCQLVVARELGLPSWPKLKAHIERMTAAQKAIADGAPAPDGDRPTLHLRCGSDIQEGLKRAGFAGDFLEFADPYCQGPVPRDGDFVDIRARFIAEAYGFPLREIRERQTREYAALADAAARFPRIVLWFEHDSYDQLILAKILAHFAEAGRPRTLELICIDRFPAIARFNGLGQLSPVALRTLWERRAPVTEAQLDLGTAVWQALRAPSPQALFAIAAPGTPALPEMAPALTRHLMELPWTVDGLSLTERLALQQLDASPMTVGRIFAALHREAEPLPFLGDLMFWSVLRDMQSVSEPPYAVEPATASEPWPHRKLVLTETGKELLAGRLDWLSLGPKERWVGGVRIAPDTPGWRWHGDRGEPVEG